MVNKNEIKVYTTSNGAELNISAPSTKQVISATNNRAQYYAEQAKKYRDEAKLHKENAQYYAEQNSDVTFEYINNIKGSLENKINEKQDVGNYALKEELPTLVSELENDANYVNDEVFNLAVEELKLPEQEGFSGCLLTTNGEECHWTGINSFQLFDTKLTDKVLSYEESQGWALQGTYVYKEALVGSRYGYPDFYNKCLEEYNEATNTETVNGVTVKVHSNGHKYYNISNKSSIDSYFNTNGSAWFYGIDTTNKRIFLPRDKYFSIKKVSKTAPVAGNGTVLGLTDGTNNAGLVARNTQNAMIMTGVFNTAYGTSASGSQLATNTSFGVTTDATKSGLVANTSNIIQFNENKYLYICVGNTTNYEGMINIINQGMDILQQVNEGINSCVHVDGSNAQFVHIVNAYVNGTSWYRVYSDGYCEQGGIWSYTHNARYMSTSISLLKPLKKVLSKQATSLSHSSISTVITNAEYSTTSSSTSLTKMELSAERLYTSTTSSAGKVFWEVKGYIN